MGKEGAAARSPVAQLKLDLAFKESSKELNLHLEALNTKRI